MEILVQPNPETASALAAAAIAKAIYEKPTTVLGLATGSTPLALYRELIRLHRDEGLDFSKVRTFNLDEYLGLSPDHPASYSHFMRVNFFAHVNLNPQRTHIPSGLVSQETIPAHCEHYEEEIAQAGGIDIQILGIGSDGHIGFNEPSSSLTSRTRIKTLTERTRLDNSAHFVNPDDVPHHVITMGIGTIMEARKIFLLAFGENKATAVAGAAEGPITASLPASILQMHRHAHFYIDPLAASKLTRLAYYEWVLAHKPAWQRDDIAAR